MATTPLRPDLARQCSGTAEAAAAAGRWFTDNAAEIRDEHASLRREFREFARAADTLARAVDRPMALGVFGPAQAGKSGLVSALASRSAGPLIADFDGVATGLDFLRQINPEGRGLESTGLVTRFTLRRRAAPPGFPVAVRLLSQADIVKVLGNIFFSDGDLGNAPTPDAARIAKRAERAVLAARSAAPLPGLGEDDVWDIQEYFERRFEGEPLVQTLGAAGYWALAAELAPRLPLVGRAALFSLLWGDAETLTALYVKLVEALERLSYAGEAFCPIEALVARSGEAFLRAADSVLHVRTLDGLRRDQAPAIDVCIASGAVAALQRPVLAALIAELHITMREPAWDFLDNADLLDFPGARRRRRAGAAPADLEADTARADDGAEDRPLSGLPDLFLRGKIAYLFERYAAAQEMTALLLCLRPEPQDVPVLPAIAKEWIDLTHGPDPQRRKENETALFVVLTHFDQILQDGAGDAEESAARWSRLIEATLLGFLGESCSWPAEWTPGRPFDNCFWLRNPNARARALFDYDENGVETAIWPAKLAELARRQAEYLDNTLVRRHFHDPAAAWDEALRLGDGGVSRLAKAVAPVSDPQLKLRKIAADLDALRGAMRERLLRYYLSEDEAEQAESRRAAAREVVDNLLRCVGERRFGGLIRLLQSSSPALAEVFVTLVNQRALPTGATIDHTIRRRLGLPLAAAAADVRDAADAYAGAALIHWIAGIRSLTDNPRICRHFRMAEKAMSLLVDELIAGASRLDLRHSIAERIRPTLRPHRSVMDQVAAPSLLAADSIGAFVASLGYDALPAAERPLRSGGAQGHVFEMPPPADRPDLGERPAGFDRRFCADWLEAYLDFVDRNVAGAGRRFDVQQNARLGDILIRLGHEPLVARAV
jgi:hypothetical protein